MNNNIKKICIITPGILASNPRVVKEAEALSEAGYVVHIIYTRHVRFLIETDQAILDQHPLWTVDHLDWAGSSLKPKLIKITSGLTKRTLSFLLKRNLILKSYIPVAINRFHNWQLKKAITWKADLYIAHYPESLMIAATAAHENKAKFAYDAEDYHRGENLPDYILKSTQITEDLLLHKASYITAASSMIGQAYQKLYPGVPIMPVENMFPIKLQPLFRDIACSPFRFFWFSQTIGPSRGLEAFIAILGQTQRHDLQLTLLGNVQENYQQELEQLWRQAGLPNRALIFKSTVPEIEIFSIASEHHFGLCLEIPSVLNKDLCMSNKLYSYILSGNYLICSETKAQRHFLEQNPGSGLMIDLQQPSLAAAKLLQVLKSPETIAHVRKRNYELGSLELNFDREKKKLLDQVDGI